MSENDKKGGKRPQKRLTSKGKGKPNQDQRFKKRKGDPLPSFSEEVRLNKFIANAGICSRREADVLIAISRYLPGEESTEQFVIGIYSR